MGHLVKNCEPPPEPSTDCSTCGADCNSPLGTAILVVSGFTGVCAGLNFTYILEEPDLFCDWHVLFPVDNLANLDCIGGQWNLLVDFQATKLGECFPCALICTGDHPTGSGTLIGSGDCVGQTGTFTLT